MQLGKFVQEHTNSELKALTSSIQASMLRMLGPLAGLYLQHQLCSLAVLATNEEPRAVTTDAFANSLNTVIDRQGKRNALLGMHVPK